MQLVGATSTYIRLPFICEGLLDGVIGALLAVGLLALARAALWPRLLEALPWAQLTLLPVDARVLAASSSSSARRSVSSRRGSPSDATCGRNAAPHRGARRRARTHSGAGRRGRTTIEQRIASQRAKAAADASAAARKARGAPCRHAPVPRFAAPAWARPTPRSAKSATASTRFSRSTARPQRRIDWNTIQLDAARKSLELHDALLKRRLVDVYEYGDLTYVNALISARSFSEFVERWEDLRLLIAANERTVRARKAARAARSRDRSRSRANAPGAAARRNGTRGGAQPARFARGRAAESGAACGGPPPQRRIAGRRDGESLGRRGVRARGIDPRARARARSAAARRRHRGRRRGRAGPGCSPGRSPERSPRRSVGAPILSAAVRSSIKVSTSPRRWALRSPPRLAGP